MLRPDRLTHKLTQATIRRLKQDPTYKVDISLSGRMLYQVLFYRIVAILRSIWYRFRIQNQGGIFFIGSNVTIRHPQMLSIGRGVIIEDHVFIDPLSEQGVRLGNNVTIARYTTIQCTGVIQHLGIGITIGNYSSIGAYSFLGAQGGITIGNNVIMGPYVSFHAENHVYQRIDEPIRVQGVTRRGIIVEDDCWIGARCTILDGVHIGRGCVIAAGSVVTKSIPAYSIAAGVPARVIKSRYKQTPANRGGEL